MLRTSADCMHFLNLLVRILDLREVDWCGFLTPAVRTGADFCYGPVRLVDSHAILCNQGCCDAEFFDSFVFDKTPVFHISDRLF